MYLRLKRFIGSCFLLLFTFTLVSAATNFNIDTFAIQTNIKKVPASAKKNASKLGSFMSSTFKDDPSKAYAIAYFLATNIDFDFNGLQERRTEKYSSDMVFEKKKALCGEFAQVFKDVCDSAGLQAEIIVGYIKDFDFIPNDNFFRSEHTWSAVKINNKWQLVDLVYASGRLVPKEDLSQITDSIFYSMPYYSKCKFEKRFNSKWIFADPAMVIRSHYPVIKDFQLLDYSLSFDEFRAGEETINKHVNSNTDTIANSEEIIEYTSKSPTDKLFFLGDYGLKKNKFNNQLKGFCYLDALDLLVQQQFDAKKNIITGKKSDLKKLKRISFVTDSLLKLSLKDNDTEFAQIQKRSEGWKANLKQNNKLHCDVLKARIKVNTTNLKLVDNIYQKGITITEHLNSRKAQFVEKSLENVKRPKVADPKLEKESKLMMKQQEDFRKQIMGVLFEIENINRSYSQEKVTSICETEKEALKIYNSCINNLQSMAEKYKTTLSMVHIPTTNVEKEWLRKELEKADNVNTKNIDVMLIKLNENELKLYEYIKLYTGYFQERLNLLKQAKKSSTIDQKEDSLYLAAVSNYSDNLLSYHYELKTCTITKELLEKNLEDENKKMTQLIEKLQKQSEVENLRHKTYLEYRKTIRNGENLRTKMAMKKLINLNTLIDKSMMTAK